MKSATSSRNTSLATVLLRQILPALLLTPLLGMSVTAFAADGRLSFRGSITQPTCAVVSMPVIPAVHERSLSVESNTTGEVNTVCGIQAVPVSAQFQPMSATAMAMAGSGILTLTYQ